MTSSPRPYVFLKFALEESKKKNIINIVVLGNDREREKKRSGLEARKKKLCYAHRIINCREKGQRFKKKKEGGGGKKIQQMKE